MRFDNGYREGNDFQGLLFAPVKIVLCCFPFLAARPQFLVHTKVLIKIPEGTILIFSFSIRSQSLSHASSTLQGNCLDYFEISSHNQPSATDANDSSIILRFLLPKVIKNITLRFSFLLHHLHLLLLILPRLLSFLQKVMASLSFSGTHIKTGRSSASGFGLSRRPTSLIRPSRGGFKVYASETQAEPDLSVKVNGLHMPNPFVIGSGPPGTNYTVMKRAFDEGWGAVIAKTVSLDAAKVINVTPRYARLRASANGSAKGEIIGWENIELISDRPLETMLKEFKQLKEEYPDRILIASIMEEYNKSAWQELIDRVEQTGVDAIEINFSCPHGMPERKMGAAVGQDCALLEEVCGWINEKATVPVWAKMTPNITDITQPARVALRSGCEGVSAINTIMSVMGINLDTLHPEPCVEGYSTPGGYSAKAVHPIALGKVMNIAKMMKSEFDSDSYSLSAIGGVEKGGDAAEFILLGANTVQVCTGVMMHGYGLVKKLCAELKDFMKKHNFTSIEDFRGVSLPYFTTHTDLVKRQQEAIRQRKAIRKGLQSDKDWTGDGFVKETESMVSN